MKRFLLSLIFAAASFAGDITVAIDSSVADLTLTQRQRVESVRSLWDYIVLDNGLTGTQSVVRLIVKPMSLGASGPLASTQVIQYAINSRGKLVADGNRSITIKLNTDAGLATWPTHYFACVVFHEIAHTLGMNTANFIYNGFVGGTINAPDNRYVGPALLTYRMERDPSAAFIPTDFGHLAEPDISDPWYNEAMTTGLSSSQYIYTFISLTTVRMIEDNGWTVNPAFSGGMLTNILPSRRLKDEDPL